MNVLILSASTGGGHNRASNALKSYITSQDKNAKVDIIDTLKYCSSILDKTVTIGYKTQTINVHSQCTFVLTYTLSQKNSIKQVSQTRMNTESKS